MKDPLFGNKVAAAALIVILLAFGLPIVINTLTAVFGGHHGHHDADPENPFHLAYIPADIQVGSGPAPEVVKVDLGTLMAAASAERGQRAAGLCTACHTLEKDGANGIGPNLWNVVGRAKGAVSGFGYSNALTSFGGDWSYEQLDGYLANSSSFMPGTQMAQMVRKDKKRADLLAYLGTLADSPLAFPEPAPPAAPEIEDEPSAEAE